MLPASEGLSWSLGVKHVRRTHINLLLQYPISLLRKVNASAPTGRFICVCVVSFGIAYTAVCVLSRPFRRGLTAADIISYHIIAREWRGHHPPTSHHLRHSSLGYVYCRYCTVRTGVLASRWGESYLYKTS